MIKISKYDKSLLDQIVKVCNETYNCYKGMVMLETNGLKDSDAYNQRIKLIIDNHRLEYDLFELLDIKDEKYLDACCDYLYYRCDEEKVEDSVCHRILYQLEDKFILTQSFDSFDADDYEDIEKVVNFIEYVMSVIGIIVKNDLNIIYVNETRELVYPSERKVGFNMDLYNFIYENVNLESEFLDKNFNFSSDSYLYSALRVRILGSINEKFSKISNLDELYLKAIDGICSSELIFRIEDYEKNKSTLSRVSLVSYLIAMFIMKEAVSIGNIEISSDQTGEYKQIAEEAFERYEKRRSKYKKLF